MNPTPLSKSYKYINVHPEEMLPGRKTRDYFVWTKHGDLIGRIIFYSRWRQHVLMVEPDTVWSTGCLADVCDFIENIKRGQVVRA